MATALSQACRSAEDLLSRCIQVRALGTTTWVEPSSTWENVRAAVLSMVEKKDGAFAFIRSTGSCTMIQSTEMWKTICAEGIRPAANGGRMLELQYVAPDSQCCATDNQGCPPSKCCPPTKCCPPASSGCGGSSRPACQPARTAATSSCCSGGNNKKQCGQEATKPAKEEPKKVCCHPIAGEFSKPKDCRSKAPASCGPSTDAETCVKCPAMFEKKSPAMVQDPGPKPVNPTLSQYKYSGDALRACQLPLGPLGGGVIAVAGDGGLRQWQVVNEVNHVGHVPDSFWAVKVDMASGNSISKVLQSDALYDSAGFVPAYIITDHIVPPASIDLLKKLPGVPEVEITAKYPTVEVEYPNSGLPVDIHMTAFNPCIPLNSTDSGIPVIVFNFEVTNPLGEDVQVSLLNSQQNMVGWDGHSEITNGVYDSAYGGNSNSLLRLDDNMVAIDMINSALADPNGRHYNSHDGHFASAALTEEKDTVSTLLQYFSVESMWAEFTSPTGLSGIGITGPSPSGRTYNGALAVTRVVPARSKTTFTFFLSWYFPYRFTNWSQPGFGQWNPPMYLGNKYSKLWPNLDAVLKYTHQNLQRLSDDTLSFRDCMFNSTLPWQLIDSAAGRVSPLRSPTCMWLSDGRFYAFEGCDTKSGCCPLNCTHVWNYEQALCQLWPDLEDSMRDVDLASGHQVTPHGRLLSRCDLPLITRPQWMYWKNYDAADNSTGMCVDGEMGGVLKLYREVRFGAKRQLFDAAWPQVKAIMKRWLEHNDQGDGTMKIAQPNTYDTSMYGVNTFIGTLYLAGLLASHHMATMQGEHDLAAEYLERYQLGAASLDRKCFTNGQWYTQQVDPEHAIMIVSDATFVDCLLGQWWGYILGLGDILPFDHCKSTVKNIFAHNHRDQFIPAEQSPRPFYDQRDSGMVIATWPSGVPPGNRLQYTTECAWTGLSHYFASLCIYLGEIDTGLHILEDSRNSYDGTRRSPWNEIECGDHYSRPMCAFQLFPTASGITWNLMADNMTVELGFNPRLVADDFAGFYSLPSGWGQYTQQLGVGGMSGKASLVVAYGKVALNNLSIPFNNTTVKASVANSKTAVNFRVTKTSTGITLTFSGTLVVDAKQTLLIEVGSSAMYTAY